MQQLIHPIYLDVAMLVAFAGHLAGGLAMESEITEKLSDRESASRSSKLRAGLSGLMSGFASVTASVGADAGTSRDAEATRRELRKHTEASIAIELYNELLASQGYVMRPETADQLITAEPGGLVELRGVAEKNSVDEVIDVIHALSILMRMSNDSADGRKSQGKNAANPLEQSLQGAERIRKALDDDRHRTPFSNLILSCDRPRGLTAAISLKRENLRDLTLSELQHNRVAVLGKVVRVVSPGEEMSAFGNYGMSLLTKEVQEETFGKARSAGLTARIRSPFIAGPAVQILPLMVFV